MAKLRALIEALASEESLDPVHQDHPLKGEWQGFREAHIAPDWLLIYRVAGDELRLARTGRHSDLFDE